MVSNWALEIKSFYHWKMTIYAKHLFSLAQEQRNRKIACIISVPYASDLPQVSASLQLDFRPKKNYTNSYRHFEPVASGI